MSSKIVVSPGDNPDAARRCLPTWFYYPDLFQFSSGSQSPQVQYPFSH